MKKFRIISAAVLFAAIGLISCNPNAYKAVTNITLNRDSLVLNAGEEYVLQATVTPDNATNKYVIWNSSNDAVATVTNGVVRAVSGGTAHIIAQADDKTATCKIIVSWLSGTSWRCENFFSTGSSATLSFFYSTYSISFFGGSIFNGTYIYNYPNVSLFQEDGVLFMKGEVIGNQIIFGDMIFIKQ